MKLAFVFVGGHKEAWATELADTYTKKLKPFVSTEVIRLKPAKQERASQDQKLKEESDAILKTLQPNDLVVLCDERGDLLTSKKLSEKLVKLFERGKSRVVVVIGGAFGASEELKKRADWTWSLSPLTFNHHFAQGIAMEQVYRAFTIWKGLPYHNE